MHSLPGVGLLPNVSSGETCVCSRLTATGPYSGDLQNTQALHGADLHGLKH